MLFSPFIFHEQSVQIRVPSCHHLLPIGSILHPNIGFSPFASTFLHNDALLAMHHLRHQCIPFSKIPQLWNRPITPR